MAQTVDHGEIRAWAERHGGRPQAFDNPATGLDRVGIRIDFPGTADEAFPHTVNAPRDITWDDFFMLFDRLGLSFVYEDPEEEPADKSSLYRFERRLRA